MTLKTRELKIHQKILGWLLELGAYAVTFLFLIWLAKLLINAIF